MPSGANDDRREFNEELKRLMAENNAKRIVEITYELQRALYAEKESPDPFNTPNALKMRDLKSFIRGNVAESDENGKILPEKQAFVLKLIDEFNKATNNARISFGKKLDEWERKITSNEITHTELIQDEPNNVKKLAHAILVSTDMEAYFAIGSLREFVDSMSSKTFNGKPFLEVANDSDKKSIEELCTAEGISKEKFKYYGEYFKVIEPSLSIGYVINNKLENGVPMFEKIPYYYDLALANTEDDQYEALEKSYAMKALELECYVEKIKSAVKVAKYLYKEFKDIKDKEDNAREERNAHKADKDKEPYDPYMNYADRLLENFTHLGTDYKYNKSAVGTSDIGVAYVDVDTKQLEEAISNVINEGNDKYIHLTDDKASEVEIDEARRKVTVALLIQEINNLVLNATDSFREIGAYKSGLDQDAMNFRYVGKYRKKQGQYVVGTLKDDDYTKSLDAITESLSDSLVNDAQDPKCYNDLMHAVKESKWLYKKMKDFATQGDEARFNKYYKLQKESTAKVKDAIKKCRRFERGDNALRGIMGASADRDEILDSLVKAMDKKHDPKENYYASYIRLHTGEHKGDTPETMIKNVTKVMAAYSLHKLNKPFSISEIHKRAKLLEEIYLLDNNWLPIRGKALTDALKDEQSVLKAGERLRTKYYGVKEDKYDDYIKEMNTLYNCLRTKDGRSTEYKAFHDAVKALANADKETANMSPDAKEAYFSQANINLVRLIDKYVKGKEKVRRSAKGNDAFAHCMDALSIYSKYTTEPGQPFNTKMATIVHKINTVRKEEGLEVYPEFVKKYGAKRAADHYKASHPEAEAGNNNNANKENVIKHM